MWPAVKSRMTWSSIVTKLQRTAQSSGPKPIPCAAASSGARPVKYSLGLYPNRLKLATSEPAGKCAGRLLPGPRLLPEPRRPWPVSVLPVEVSCPPGSLAVRPRSRQGIMIAYFMVSSPLVQNSHPHATRTHRRQSINVGNRRVGSSFLGRMRHDYQHHVLARTGHLFPIVLQAALDD